jgi:glycosyltransferase involved in cell wall biosynthesis
MDRGADATEPYVGELLSIVIPVRNEAPNIRPLFDALSRDVKGAAEALIVYDADDDPTVPAARENAQILNCELRLIKNDLGRGPANAIRAGFAAARGAAIVVVMADLSDELSIVDEMRNKIRGGCDIVCGSRYMRGGRQIGGPLLKRTLSRIAGMSLYLWGLPTHDSTNAFKMYRTDFLRSLKIEGSGGFEISMEITVKGWLAGGRICEIPATWTDRVAGDSKFRLMKWLPRYLHWYFYAVRGRFFRPSPKSS